MSGSGTPVGAGFLGEIGYTIISQVLECQENDVCLLNIRYPTIPLAARPFILSASTLVQLWCYRLGQHSFEFAQERYCLFLGSVWLEIFTCTPVMNENKGLRYLQGKRSCSWKRRMRKWETQAVKQNREGVHLQGGWLQLPERRALANQSEQKTWLTKQPANCTLCLDQAQPKGGPDRLGDASWAHIFLQQHFVFLFGGWVPCHSGKA